MFLLLFLHLRRDQSSQIESFDHWSFNNWRQDVDWGNLNLWGFWPEVHKLQQMILNPKKRDVKEERLFEMSQRLKRANKQKDKPKQETWKENPNQTVRRSSRIKQPT